MRAKDEQDEGVDYTCGIGNWRPQWMQKLASPKMFLLNLGLAAIIQGGSWTYFIGSLSTLEKRYAFSSTISGVILIADNISELALGPVFGYLANRIHRPRLIGVTLIITGLGCFVAALPYFIYGPAVHLLTADPTSLSKYSAKKTVDYCDVSRNLNSDCLLDNGSNTVWVAVFFIFVASFLNGFGTTVYFTVGIPFIDDSVKKKNSPMYLSATTALRILGPTGGFMLSSLVLRMYEDPSIDPGITDRKDPRWVGAWWIGFIVLGVAIILISLPMFLYPSEFRKVNSNKIVARKEQVKKLSLWYRVKRLATNPIYMCYVISTDLRLFAVLGYITFKPKYIESEYKKSASAANLFSGIIGIIPTAVGIFLGGLIVQCFKPRPRILTLFTTIVEIFGVMGILSALFLGCPASQFAGLQIDSQVQVQLPCSSNCSCGFKTFQPVCGPDHKTNYFSPCFAGCDKSSMTSFSNNTHGFTDCQCFTGQSVEGYCETDCGNNFWTYALMLAIASVMANLAKTGNSVVSFRIVDPEDKSLAVGLAGSFLCIFAFIPYPLVYGAVTDSACLIWEEKCGQRGNCWFYDSVKFRNILHGLTLGLYLTGSLFDFIVVILSNRIKNLYDDEEEVKEADEFDSINLEDDHL